MIGQIFGKLTVISYENSKRVGVLCECGEQKVVRANALRAGVCRSCGCLRAQMLSERRKTHGLTESREYRAWCHMKDRCLNPKTKGYEYWGGRGIKVCDTWVNSFMKFFEDMGTCPKGYSLDRIDPNGNYEASNCRWADSNQQSNNTRRNIFLTHEGKTQTIAQWAKEVGILDATLRRRIRVGEPVEMALNSALHCGKRIV